MSDESATTEVTDLLNDWAAGDQEALDKLVPLVYERMRRLAASFLRRERAEHTLQTTALVHEAFLRLVDQQRVRYQSRAQFFANAGRMMRRILVDYARARKVQKRGSEAERLPEEILELLPTPGRPPDLVALDDALGELSKEQPELASIVELKFFVGFTVAEIAAVTEQGSATVQRRWKLARAWLYRRLSEGSVVEGPDP
jgi:RNA polymerase sigma factor (TIGR02999 family)